MFDQYSTDEKRRLRLGAAMFAVGSLALGATSLQSASSTVLAVYFGGAVVFTAIVALLTRDIRAG